MHNKKLNGFFILFVAFIIWAFAWFVYDVYVPNRNTEAIRLQHLNWLINNLGKIPVVIGFILLGVAAFRTGLKILRS